MKFFPALKQATKAFAFSALVPWMEVRFWQGRSLRSWHLSFWSVILLLCVLPVNARADVIVNFENDADLGAALRFDSETNGGNRQISDQAMAEKSYLAYLERARDPDQRTRVYVQLGVLFSTNWHKEAGEKPDYEKARRYFQNALRAAPDRIGIPMIRARLGMATPLQKPEVRLTIRLETYKWLSSVDEQQLRNHWLKSHPTEIPNEDQIKSTLGIVKNVILAENDNIFDEAKKSGNRSEALQRIIATIPNTDLAKSASTMYAVVVEKASVDRSGNIPTRIAGNRGDTELAMGENDASRQPPWKTIAFGVAAIVVLVVLVLGYYFRRRKHVSRAN
jgi:hypothetical protein